MFIAVADVIVNLLPTASHMMRAGYAAAVCVCVLQVVLCLVAYRGVKSCLL
jgi:hypothetical protein